MKYTEKDLYDGMQLRCKNKSVADWWTTGKVYIVRKTPCEYTEKYGKYYLIEDNGNMRDTQTILRGLNNESAVIFKQTKEEKQMQEFKLGDLVEITSNTSNARNEKDELYNVGEKAIITDVHSTTVRIGNHKWANLITKDEIKKVEPTATITVDVEQRLNDKIEALSVERQNIFDKMERMDRQEVKLRDKINKLKEAKKALEILKEFK